MKQQQEPQAESDIIVARRRSLREPSAKQNLGADAAIEEVRVLRQSTRRKSNVEQAIEQRDEEKSNENSFSVPSKRRSARHVSTKETEATEVANNEDASLSPTTTRSLRFFPKPKVPTLSKVTTRRIGSILVITGIRSWPEERHSSLKLRLNNGGQANGQSPSNSSRKRRRINDAVAVKDEENDGSPKKRVKETDSTVRGDRTQRRIGGKVEPPTESSITQAVHNVTDDDGSQLENSFELVKDDEKDSRADRAARRNAKNVQLVQSEPKADESESLTKTTKQQASQDESTSSVDSKPKDNETLLPPVSPNFLPDESLPPIFLDFPEKPLPETAFADKAAYLHAQRYRPLPPLARFTAALLSHPPTSRSTETLLALAANTQRALQAYQDEYIELDLKTSRVSGPIPKKAATGGRQVIDEIKWQAEKEKELFGEGSILAGLRKAAVDTTTKRQKERKARRGEVDMLAAGLAPGKPSGAVPKVNVSDADEIAERGRAQRSRKPVKRFEDAIADAERAPSKRRRKNLEPLIDRAVSSAPSAVAAGKKVTGTSGDKSKPGSDKEEEEDEGLVKPKWNNPSRPQSSLARTAQPKQAATKPASNAAPAPPPNVPAEPQQHPHYVPPYHHPAVMPGYPVYDPYPPPPPPGAYYPPYAGHYPGHPMPALPPQAHHEHYYTHPPPPHYYHPHPGPAPPGHHPQQIHPHHAQHYAQHPLAQSTLPPQPPPHPQPHGHPHPPQQSHPSHPDHATASNSTSTQPRGQLPGSKDRRKVPNNTSGGTPANGNGSAAGTSRSRKEPHEKSELRSASMTKWWAERKVKIAAQKEQEKKDAEAAALAEAAVDAEAKAKGNGASS